MKRRSFALLVPLLLVGCGYNRIQQLDERAQQEKQQISVQLQRRADLVPNLVASVKGYAQHEEAVFTQVANARSAVMSATAPKNPDPAVMAAAEAQLNTALGRLIAVAEAYPTLKADQSFLKLQDELAGTENRFGKKAEVKK